MTKRVRHPYGKAVVGEEEAARVRQAKKDGTNIYGPRVTGERESSSAPKEKRVVKRIADEETTPADAALSIKELGELLEKSPGVLDRQIDAEFQRAEGPRKGALRLFLGTETGREGGPRGDVMAILENALTGE